ncbi:MAG: AIR synthase-related protein [Promethearchaeota archaeon]
MTYGTCMTDLEGIANRLIDLGKGKDEIILTLKQMYKIFKTALPDAVLEELSKSVFQEVEKSRVTSRLDLIKDLLSTKKRNLSIGDQGVGCRGLGDFFVHNLVTKLASKNQSAFLSPESMDDAGAVKLDANPGSRFIVSKMEGMHSRLSNYPFLAAFHVTRACLRDLLVKGARPISIMVDIHLGDDSDVTKLFDFMSGVACVAELAGVPITAGSTLRIGGDMVIGNRITGGIAGIGVSEKVLARKNIKPDSDIIMTEGAGGGTVATTAIFNGMPDKIIYTLNVKFLDAMNLLLGRKDLLDRVYCCTDVTNGGLRGDLFEILQEANAGVEVHEKFVAPLVHPEIKQLLEITGTDYLGVSLDALLVFCAPRATPEIVKLFEENGIKASKIGACNATGKVRFHASNGETTEFKPMFRESAYTPVKKVVGETKDEKTLEEMNLLVQEAYQDALDKKDRILKLIQTSRKEERES